MEEQLPNKLSALLACLSLLFITFGANARVLTGIKTVPRDDLFIGAAVVALNTNGVGGVTINVAAGHSDTITFTIVHTSTVANPIVFQKNDMSANPVIVAYAGIATVSEINNRGFEIERSLNSRSFETVGFVKGAGNSRNRLNILTMINGLLELQQVPFCTTT